MGIFSNGDSPESSADDKGINSIIGKGMTVQGDISFEGKIRIDGKVDGNFSGDYLILSETGYIIGDIDATTVVCHGRVDGNLKAGKVFIKKTGVINGRLETSGLSVETGGVLNGEIRSQNSTDEPAPIENVESSSLPQPSEG